MSPARGAPQLQDSPLSGLSERFRDRISILGVLILVHAIPRGTRVGIGAVVDRRIARRLWIGAIADPVVSTAVVVPAVVPVLWAPP